MNNNSLDTPESISETPSMGLLEHLGELRHRLIIIALSVLATSTVSYTFSNEVLEILCRPFFDHFKEGMLVGSGPADAFILKIKVAIFCGVLLASPIIFMQIWLFIAPGLYSHERKLVVPFVVVATALFLIGVYFCNRLVLPLCFDFFKEQYESIKPVSAVININEHLSLVLQALIGFGVVFEMPVLAFFLAKVGIVDHKMMLSGTRYAVVIIFIVAAILTPPDVLTQFLMALPLMFLYGLSIIIVKFTEKKPVEVP